MGMGSGSLGSKSGLNSFGCVWGLLAVGNERSCVRTVSVQMSRLLGKANSCEKSRCHNGGENETGCETHMLLNLKRSSARKGRMMLIVTTECKGESVWVIGEPMTVILITSFIHSGSGPVRTAFPFNRQFVINH